ncbi:hypothetical protein [Listeria aquatica]|uniref:Uncharacterized protein n=1 Tax=Listeria aquatica FSL S10-1188 TaxID=1265818 RepID=W7ASD1_9LIST|nr:hypothetical protein [Listeria aquatica]EUJ16512.1 hypothetical protein MAQA_16016 [Listeria aquatica FSL S10-1188]
MKGRYLKAKKGSGLSNDQKNSDLYVEMFVLKLMSGASMSLVFIPFYYLVINDGFFDWVVDNKSLLTCIILGAMLLMESYMLLNKTTVQKMKSRASEKSKKSDRSFDQEYSMERHKRGGIVVLKVVCMTLGVLALVLSKFDGKSLKVISFMFKDGNQVISGLPEFILYMFLIALGFTLFFYELLKYISLLIQNFKQSIVDPKDRLSMVITIFGLAISLIALFK